MNTNHEILIFQLSAELPAQLRETLVGKGLQTTVTSDQGAVLQKLKASIEPILMVTCGDDMDFAFECTKKLIGMQELHEFPLVLVGKDVDSYENILNKNFIVATAISTPCAVGDIVEGVNYIIRTYPKAKAEVSSPSLTDSSQIKPTLSQALRISEAPPVQKHQIFKDFDGIPELFFSQLSSLKLSKDGIGGLLYPRALNESWLKNGEYTSTEPRFQEAIREISMDAGKWGRLHLQRVSYIAHCIAAALEISTESLAQMKSAIFLFPSSFVGENPDLLRREYHENRYSAFRRELCSRIKDSAMDAALNLQAPDVGNLLATLGRLIGREEQVTDTPLSISASIVMGADLTDRVCYQSGHWNPRKAYLLMQKIRSEQIIDIHPRVLCAIVKFLSEAMTSHPYAFVVPRSLRRDPHLQKAAQMWQDQKVKANEKKVPLVSLMPGMKLSRPVITYDGLEILSGDLTLDQDLIWRLWQLSSIRPVNGPLVVFSEN